MATASLAVKRVKDVDCAPGLQVMDFHAFTNCFLHIATCRVPQLAELNFFTRIQGQMVRHEIIALHPDKRNVATSAKLQVIPFVFHTE